MRRTSTCIHSSWELLAFSGRRDRNRAAPGFLLDHRVDQTPGPERACVDVHVVEVAIRGLVDRALLCLDDDLVFQKNPPSSLKNFARHALFVHTIVSKVAPEVVARLCRGRGRNVDHPHPDASLAMAFRCTASCGGHSDVENDRGRRLEMNNLPAVHGAGLAELRAPEWRSILVEHPAPYRGRGFAMHRIEGRLRQRFIAYARSMHISLVR